MREKERGIFSVFFFSLKTSLYTSKTTFRNWSKDLHFKRHNVEGIEDMLCGQLFPDREGKKALPLLEREAHGLERWQGKRYRELETLSGL